MGSSKRMEEESQIRLFKARVRFAKSSVRYTGLFNSGFHTQTIEVHVEAENALKAKLLIESEYGPNSCVTFPKKVEQEE